MAPAARVPLFSGHSPFPVPVLSLLSLSPRLGEGDDVRHYIISLTEVPSDIQVAKSVTVLLKEKCVNTNRGLLKSMCISQRNESAQKHFSSKGVKPTSQKTSTIPDTCKEPMTDSRLQWHRKPSSLWCSLKSIHELRVDQKQQKPPLYFSLFSN